MKTLSPRFKSLILCLVLAIGLFSGCRLPSATHENIIANTTIQQRLDEERSLLQSSRLGIGIIIISIIIILGLTILYYSSLLTTITSTLIHGACLAAIGIVIALLCTVLPKKKKNR